MKCVILRNAVLGLFFVGAVPLIALAQTMTANEAAPAVAAGQQIWRELQAKQVSCGTLSDTNFENLGEYFMNQMMGSSHEAMNQTIVSRVGASGEEEMHVAMGKRLSGCDEKAAYPAGVQGFMSMMDGGDMMGGSNYYDFNSAYPMMNGYGSMMGLSAQAGGIGVLGGLLWLVVLVDLILLGVWLWRGITKQ